MRYFVSLFILFYSSLCLAQSHEIAITIDDLPLVASKMNTPGNKARSTERFMNLIKALEENQVPATGFVIAGSIEKGQWEFLTAFRQAGFDLGNHTYSHINCNRAGAEKCIANIDRANKILEPVMTTPKYFRFPYLAEGRNSKDKEEILNYLKDQGYTVAPVTIDSKDYEFNESVYRVPYRQRPAYIQRLKKRYLDFIWKQTLRAEKRNGNKDKAQILLIHANLLNSYLLSDIIQMYKNNGYQFVSLTEALKNPAKEILAPAEKPVEKTAEQPAEAHD